MPYRPETNGLLTIEVKSPGCGTTMSGNIPVKIISPNRVPQNKPVSRTNDRLNLPVMPIAKPVNIERINVGPSKPGLASKEGMNQRLEVSSKLRVS
jgi:hypothetical protein